MRTIDINFNVFSDTPEGKDPDSHSATLREYHQILWSKPLPNGTQFHLDLDTPKLLHHKSQLGEFFLASDQIGNTYNNLKKMRRIISEVPEWEMHHFSSTRATIAGHAVFPAKRIQNKMTINGARGVNHKIQDRFDLTLECIRRFYLKEESPLTAVLNRYAQFFYLFDSFKGYVEFFHYHDLVENDYSRIKFWTPFYNFESSPLPTSNSEYLIYKSAVIAFIKARGIRLLNSTVK